MKSWNNNVDSTREDATADSNGVRAGREKGVWGVERACHTGQQRSLQSVCVTEEIGL